MPFLQTRLPVTIYKALVHFDKLYDKMNEVEKRELYAYLSDVKQSTEAMIKDLSYDDLKRKISEERKKQLESLSVVSDDENAIWLIDYWCNKDVRGLIQMPIVIFTETSPLSEWWRTISICLSKSLIKCTTNESYSLSLSKPQYA